MATVCFLWIIIPIKSQLLSSWSQGTATMDYNYGALPVGYYEPTHKVWLIGGYPSSATNHVFSFDLDNPIDFIQHSDISSSYDIETYSQSYVTVNNLIYIVRDTGSNTNKISTFNMATQQFTPSWNSVTVPYYTSINSAMAYHPNGYLIIIGGQDRYGSALKNFQILRLSNNQWFHGPDMLQSRDSFCASIVNNKLYAIGDTNQVSKISLIDIENINSGSYNWNNLVKTLSGTDTYVRSVVYNNDIYVIGGDSGTPIDVIHSLTDTITNNINTMYTTVRNGGAVIAMNKIYYFGGYCPSCNGVINTYQYASLPTSNPTKTPTKYPTKTPTKYPTKYPSKTPTKTPSKSPTVNPTEIATTKTPTTETITPTITPTYIPTINPTFNPTNIPTYNPTIIPTYLPTENPTFKPTMYPSMNPTYLPSNQPSEITNSPSNNPSNIPSNNPTVIPTFTPTNKPSINPTIEGQGHVDEKTTENDINNTNYNDVGNALESDNKSQYWIYILIGCICICLLIFICIIFIRIKKRKTKFNTDSLSVKKHIDTFDTRHDEKLQSVPSKSSLANTNGELQGTFGTDLMNNVMVGGLIMDDIISDMNNNNNNNNVTPMGPNDNNNGITPMGNVSKNELLLEMS
eukprot:25485_1